MCPFSMIAMALRGHELKILLLCVDFPPFSTLESVSFVIGKGFPPNEGKSIEKYLFKNRYETFLDLAVIFDTFDISS